MDQQEKKTVYQQQPGNTNSDITTINSDDATGRNTAQEPEKKEMAQNPNPRANENIKDAPIDTGKNPAQQVGSEITDGEDG